jgi:hypothetical protein
MRTAPRRVRQRLQEAGLRAPHRPIPRAAPLHDGTRVTERVDEVRDAPVCATGSSRPAHDPTRTVTTGEGRATVFIAIDHCSGEGVGSHAASSARRGRVRAPIRQDVARHGGGVGRNAARDLILRPDHGPNDRAEDVRKEIRFLGITSSPSCVCQPEGNGVAERALRRLTAPLLGRGTLPPSRTCGRPWPRSPRSPTPPGCGIGMATRCHIRSGPSQSAFEAATAFRLAA